MDDEHQASREKLGHNSAPSGEAHWARYTKKQTYVRALEGTYGELTKELYSQPRVFHTAGEKWDGGPASYYKRIIAPESGIKITQAIECHIDVFVPGVVSKGTHGHMNSACFYVLKGKGHDIHDGRRMDWEAGDCLIVETACVHEHIAENLDDETIVLVMKAKPLFLFMHLLFQKIVEWPPKTAPLGHEDWTPPTDL
jgi:gentisate 1,2-dioxygenase